MVTLVTVRAFTLPVCLMCGPWQRSMRGPHLTCMLAGIQQNSCTLPVYRGSRCFHSLIENTQLEFVVLHTQDVPSIKSYNKYLTLNISRRSSFFISKRTKGCFSFTIDLQSVSICGKSLLDTCLRMECSTPGNNWR